MATYLNFTGEMDLRPVGSAPVGGADPLGAGQAQRAAVLPIIIHDRDPWIGLLRVADELLPLLVPLPILERVGQRLAVGRPAELVGRRVVLLPEHLAPV